MTKAIPLILLLLYFATLNEIKAQDTVNLSIEVTDDPEVELRKIIEFRETLFDTLLVMPELEKVVQQLQLSGYLEASIDDYIIEGKDAKAKLFLGPQYEWAEINSGNIDPAILSQVRYKPGQFRGRQLNLVQIRSLSERIVTYFENNGYPFASVYLENIHLDSNKVTADLHLEKNNLFTIDTIIIHGDPKISEKFLFNYLSLNSGDLYSEAVIRNISRRINELPYLSETRAVSVQFVDDKARVNLFLRSDQSSRFNFLLGVLPNSDQLGGRLLITGEANLALVNPFGTGKSIFIDWRGIKPRSPELDASFIYPYFLGTPIGIDGRLNIFKNDTFYTDLVREFGVQYVFVGNNYIRAFVRNKSTNLNSIDTARIKATKRLPQRLDISNTFYGLEYHMENLDYRFNPRKGFTFTINGSAGIKNIKRNLTIINLKDPSDSSFNFQSLYDSLNNEALNYEFRYHIANFFPIGRRATFLAGIEGGMLINQNLFENELFRIGGTNDLRGFDESSLRASFFNILNIEYRYLLSPNSFFSLFWNGAYLRREVRGEPIEVDLPFGFGAGLAFETRAGVFAVNYALGRFNEENNIRFRNAKIHFGYVNYF